MGDSTGGNFRLSNLSLLERNELWNNMKNKKLEALRASKEEKEIEGCTFEPKLNKSPVRFSNSKSLS
jgi:hypothetical protein